MVHPDIIPGWLIALVMLHLAYMGMVCHREKLFIDSIHFLFFIPQAIMYILLSIMDLPLEIRGFWVRISVLLIPACFDAILIFLYSRREKSF